MSEEWVVIHIRRTTKNEIIAAKRKIADGRDSISFDVYLHLLVKKMKELETKKDKKGFALWP